MPVLDHIHTIRRIEPNRAKFLSTWDKALVRCMDPYCSLEAPVRSFAGKAILCNLCGTEFVVTEADLRRYARPRCMACKNTKQALALKEQKSILDSLMNPVTDPEVVANLTESEIPE